MGTLTTKASARSRLLRSVLLTPLLWLSGCHDSAGQVLDTVWLAFEIARLWID